MSDKVTINGKEYTERIINHIEINGEKITDNIITPEMSKLGPKVTAIIQVDKSSLEEVGNANIAAFKAVETEDQVEKIDSKNENKKENWISCIIRKIKSMFIRKEK